MQSIMDDYAHLNIRGATANIDGPGSPLAMSCGAQADLNKPLPDGQEHLLRAATVQQRVMDAQRPPRDQPLPRIMTNTRWLRCAIECIRLDVQVAAEEYGVECASLGLGNIFQISV